MQRMTLRRLVVNVVSIALITLGTTPVSFADVVGTSTLIKAEAQQRDLQNIDAFLAREEVRKELLDLGVSPEAVTARVRNLTADEIQSLSQSIDEQVAGGDALGLIGAVFLVLLILELLGVTNVFSAF